jgi:hypothetical protein
MQKLQQLFDFVQNETPGWATTSKLIQQPINNHFKFKTDTLQPPLEQSGRNAGENAGEMRENCGRNCGRKCGRNAREKVGENAGEIAQEMS